MAASEPGQNTDDLKSQQYTLVKQKMFYDADGRPLRIVTAPTHSSNGDPASEVNYTYVLPVGSADARVDVMAERAVLSDGKTKIAWDGSWDIGGLP